VVLAATFLVFGSMPLITFAQMGIAVAVGVLLDTFIVRSVLVTALSMDLGRWMWWPGKLFHKRDEPETAPASDSPTGREPEFVS
jgi:RND superfamily putative drug exporter